MITFRKVDLTSYDEMFSIQNMITFLCRDDLGVKEFDYERLSNCLYNMSLDPNFQCYVALDSSQLVGCAGFFVTPNFYNEKLVAHELFWYVLPQYRKGVGSKLIKYVEKNIITDTIELGISNPRLQKMMERCGYSKVKTILEKKV